MGRKIIEIPYENVGIRRSGGGGANREFAEIEPRVDLSMGRIILESRGPMHSATALNLSLE